LTRNGGRMWSVWIYACVAFAWARVGRSLSRADNSGECGKQIDRRIARSDPLAWVIAYACPCALIEVGMGDTKR
jgi:hypothetical protein